MNLLSWPVSSAGAVRALSKLQSFPPSRAQAEAAAAAEAEEEEEEGAAGGASTGGGEDAARAALASGQASLR